MKEKEHIQEEVLENAAEASQEAAPSPEGSAEEKLAQELAALNDRYLRLMAEYENYRKRSTREKDEIYPSATAAAIEKFLPVLDNFERANEFERGTEEFAKGFDMIYQSMLDVVKSFGVVAIGEAGEPFDPQVHNAVMHIEDESLGENVVSLVMQKGYRMGERMIRYAMVQTAN